MNVFSRKWMRIMVFVVSILAVFSFSACDTLPEECASYLSSPFRAEVEGYADGEKISATVFCDPTEHKTKEIYNVLTVTFSEGRALEGITASLRSDGKATVRLRDSSEELPLYSGLTEPFLALCPKAEPYSVRKTDEGFEAEWREEEMSAILYFGKDGIIKRAEGVVSGRQIKLNVTSFERISQ